MKTEYDRKCTKCGTPIYQGVLCAACHSPEQPTPTPRTDFHVLVDNNYPTKPTILVLNRPVVTADFARTLERELAEANEHAEMLDKLLLASMEAHRGAEDEARALRARAELADELAEALKTVVAHGREIQRNTRFGHDQVFELGNSAPTLAGAAKAAQNIVHDIETLTRCWIETDEEEKAIAIVEASILRHCAPAAVGEGARNGVFNPDLLMRCVMGDAERQIFKTEARKVVQIDEETGAIVTAYIHPDGRTLIDRIDTPKSPRPSAERTDGERLTRDKWDMDALHDLYHDGGHAIVDFIVDLVLNEVNKQLGGKGWDAYESDGGLDEAISYNVHTLLKKNQAVEEWENRPLGPVLMGLIRLSDNESKKGKFQVTLDYDNYQDGGRVLNGDGKVIGECYEDRAGNTDEEGPDNQLLGAIIAALNAHSPASKGQGGSK